MYLYFFPTVVWDGYEEKKSLTEPRYEFSLEIEHFVSSHGKLLSESILKWIPGFNTWFWF